MDRDLMMDIERLAVPKRRQPFPDGEELNMSGLPPDPLPTWTTLPLDYKLPMIPGPKGAVSLFTTNLAEKIHKKTHEVDFDLTDPYSLFMSNYYKPLHDPHLKLHLTTPQMKRRLYKDGFITKDGKVLCTLKEFNDYRQYLRKINLLIEKRKERQNKSTSAKTQLTKKETEAVLLQHMREQKVKEIRERLAKQFEEDRARYMQLFREQEDKHRKIKQEQMNKLSEKEQKLREEDEKRHYMVQKRHIEERKRKLSKLRKWIYEDAERFARSQKRRQESDKERQKKLEESWEQRKALQQLRLKEERDRQRLDREETLKKIADREQAVGKQWSKQEEIYQSMIGKQKKERQRVEEIYAENLTKRLERKRAFLAAERRRKKKGKRSQRGRLQSIWDIGETLMNIVSLGDLREEEKGKAEKEEKELVKPCGDGLPTPDVSAHQVKSEVSEPPPESYDRLRVPDGSDVFSQGPSSESVSPRSSALDMYHVLKNHRKMKDRRPTPAIDSDIGVMRTNLIKEGRLAVEGDGDLIEEDEEDEDEQLEDVEKAAKAIVDLSMYVTTQVIYPAYMKWLEQDHPEEYKNQVEKYPHTKLMETEDMVLKNKERISRPRGSVQFQENTDIVPPSELEYLMFLHEVEEDDGAGERRESVGDEEDDEEIDPELYNRRLSLSYRDSVTRLLSQTSLNNVSLSQELEHVLKGILEELASGKLTTEQIKDLIDIARNILDGLQMLSSQQETAESHGTVTPVMISSPTSQTSLMAREIVQQTLDRVKQELLADSDFLETYGKDLGSPVSPVRSLSSLAEFIVNKAVTSAVHSLQAVTSEEEQMTGPKPRTPGRPTSAPPTPMAHPLPDVIQEEAPIQLKSTESDLVWTVLKRTAKEVESEIMKANPEREPSQMSAFVRHVLSQAAQELVSRSSGAWVDWSRKQSHDPLDSSSSDISYFVQYTISKVLKDMEEEGVIPQTDKDFPKSASSLFVENLVDITLQQCLDELNEELLPKTDLVSVAAAIIESHQDLKTTPTAVRTQYPSQTKSLSNVYKEEKDVAKQSSMLVEVFVRETLSKVMNELKSGRMSMEEIHLLAQAFGGASEQGSQQSTEVRLQQSLEAQHFVEQALEDVLLELAPDGKRYDFDQKTNIEVEPLLAKAMDKAFDEVMDELPMKNLPVKSQSSAQLENFIKTVLTNVKHEMGDIVKTHISEGRSDSQQDLQFFINDLIDKNATVLAHEQGFQYQPTRSSPSVNILVCDTPMTESIEDITNESSHTGPAAVEQLSKQPISGTKSKEATAQSQSMNELGSYINDLIAESTKEIPESAIKAKLKKSQTDQCEEIDKQNILSSGSSKNLKLFIGDVIAECSKAMAQNIADKGLSSKSHEAVSKYLKDLPSSIDNLVLKSCKSTPQRDDSVHGPALVKPENKTSVQDSHTASSKELGSLISQIIAQSTREMKKPDDSRQIESEEKLTETGQSSSGDLNRLVNDIINANMDMSKQNIPSSPVIGIQPSSKSSEQLSDFIKVIISDATGNLVSSIISSALISKEESQEKTDSHEFTSTMIDTENVDIDDVSSDENLVTAMFHDKPLLLEHSIIENALSVISVKKDHDLHHIHHYDAVPRNSFVSLQHPDLEKVKRLSHHVSSDDDLCKKIINLSSKCIETLDHEEESSESSSECDSSSCSDEIQNASTEKVISIVDIHNAFKEADSAEISNKLTKEKEPPVNTKSRTNSPYAVKLSQPKIPPSQSSNKQLAKPDSPTSSSSMKRVKQVHGSNTADRIPSQSKQSKHDTVKTMLKTKSKPSTSPLLPQRSTHSSSTKSNVKSTSYPKIKGTKEPEINRRKSDYPAKVSSIENSSSSKKTLTKEQKSGRSETGVGSSSLKKQLSKGTNSKTVSHSTSFDRTKTTNKKSSANKLDSRKNLGSSTSSIKESASKSASVTVGKQTENTEKIVLKPETESNAKEIVAVLDPSEELGDVQLDADASQSPQSSAIRHQSSEELGSYINELIRKSFVDIESYPTENVCTPGQPACSSAEMVKPDVIPNKDSFSGGEKQSSQQVNSDAGHNFTHEKSMDDVTTKATVGMDMRSSNPEEVIPVGQTDAAVEDDMGEIEEDIQPARRKISAKKSSRSSGYFPTVTSSAKDMKQKSSSNTIELVSNLSRTSRKVSSPGGSNSSVKSKRSNISSHRTPHEALSLTPRPSSGFSKSPTPFNVAGSDGGLNSASGVSMTSRIIKSISSLGDKILGRKTPNMSNMDTRSTKSVSGQSVKSNLSKGSLVVLPDIQSSTSKIASKSHLDSASRKSKSSNSTIGDVSKTLSPITLSPKASRSNLSANNSLLVCDVYGQTSSACYTHSDNEEEEQPSSQQPQGPSHHHTHHQHTKDCLSTGSLPELESQSHSLKHSRTATVEGTSSLPRQCSSNLKD